MKQTLLSLFLSLGAFAVPAQEIVHEGIYDGKVANSGFSKDCRLELTRGEDGLLTMAGVREESMAYNLWAQDGSDFKLENKSGLKVLERSLRLDLAEASRLKIYESRTSKKDRRSYSEHGTLQIKTDLEGKAQEFLFVFTGVNSKVSLLECKELRLR
jgi:hypothetical protein